MVNCIQWLLTAECDQHKCITLPLGQLGNQYSLEKGSTGTGWKILSTINFVRWSRDIFEIFSGALYWHWHGFPPAVRQGVGNIKMIPHNWRAVYQKIYIYWGTVRRYFDTYLQKNPGYYIESVEWLADLFMSDRVNMTTNFDGGFELKMHHE